MKAPKQTVSAIDDLDRLAGCCFGMCSHGPDDGLLRLTACSSRGRAYDQPLPIGNTLKVAFWEAQ